MFHSATASFAISALFLGALLLPATNQAATVTTVHVFQGGSDGGGVAGNIVIGPDGALYGKTIPNPGSITVFRLNPATGANTSLFVGNPGASDDANSGIGFGTNGALYGASYFNAGSGQCGAGCGLIFQVNGATGALTTIYRFLNTGDGRGTHSVIAGPGGSLFGVADEGGSDAQGYVFRLNPTTGEMTVVHNFTDIDGSNGDGGVRFGPDGALYGDTTGGGQYGFGTLFRVSPSSGAFKVLHQFTAADGSTGIFNSPPILAFDDKGAIYGTTVSGGTFGKGMIFRLVPATGALNVLHSFNGSDGSGPTRLVAGTDGNLYGLTFYGGTSNFGTVFEFNLSSKVFTSVYSFQNTADGAHPGQGGLTVSVDGSIYGTTQSGGGPSRSGSGTVFKITL